jgi:hypothetical protein
MSAANDGKRIAALVEAFERLAKGNNMTLGELATKVFGWSAERVFLAIDAAIDAKSIAPNRAAPWGRSMLDDEPANDKGDA